MSEYRTLNQLVLAKVETTHGTDAVPNANANAVLVENPSRQPNLSTIETNEVTGALDDRGPLPAGGFSPFTADIWLKGSDTPGTAPEFSPFMQGCALAETLQANTLSANATAGNTSSITLSAGDYANTTVGTVVAITAGTGNGQARVVAAKLGSNAIDVYPDWTVTPNTLSTYSVYANVLYKPTSTSLKTLSIYRYRHRSDGGNSKLDKILGAAGTMTFNMPVRSPCRLSFSYQGQLSTPTDVSPPGAGLYQSVRAQPYLAADTFLGGSAIKLNTLALDYGAAVQLIDNPAQAFGYDAAGVTRRRISGRLNPPLELQATRDAFASWLTGALSEFWVRWGTVAGNRVSIFIPQLLYSGVEEEDVNGFAHEGLPFRALGSDTGIYLCLY